MDITLRVLKYFRKTKLHLPLALLYILAIAPQEAIAEKINLAALPSPILLKGDDTHAFRDPTAVYHNETFYLYYTLVRVEEERKIYSYTALSKSQNLRDWTEPRVLTPKGQTLNYSSPGNVIRYDGRWVICLQTYPRPEYSLDKPLTWADQTARLFIMRSDDLENWSAPELLRVKGPNIAREKMGRMIDPYLIEDKNEPGKWWCFYKQNGVSMSYSRDLKNWTYFGRANSGENVCVLIDRDEYLLFHSPRNGVGVKRSRDLKEWREAGDLITLGQKEWPWSQTRLTAGFVLDLRQTPEVGKALMFFHGSDTIGADEQMNKDANCHLGLAWSDDLERWKWPGKKTD